VDLDVAEVANRRPGLTQNGNPMPDNYPRPPAWWPNDKQRVLESLPAVVAR